MTTRSDTATAGPYWGYALAVATAFAAVYVANVLYLKLVEDVGLRWLDVFGRGLNPVQQFLVLLLMSVFFGVTLLFHPDAGID